MHSGEYHNTYHHDFGMSGDEYYSSRRRKSPVWVAFWTSLLVSLATVSLFHFLVFPWLQKSSQTVVVPKLSGLKVAQVVPVLSSLGLRLERMARQADEQPVGTVLSHLPTSGTRVKTGTVVRVILSTGPSSKTSPSPVASTPSPSGTPSLARTETTPVPPVRPDNTTPSPSTASEGDKIAVPRLTDITLAEAKRRLKRAGLTLRHISFGSDEDKSPHWVLGQSPRPNTLVSRGSPVDLTINRDDL